MRAICWRGKRSSLRDLVRVIPAEWQKSSEAKRRDEILAGALLDVCICMIVVSILGRCTRLAADSILNTRDKGDLRLSRFLTCRINWKMKLTSPADSTLGTTRLSRRSAVTRSCKSSPAKAWLPEGGLMRTDISGPVALCGAAVRHCNTASRAACLRWSATLSSRSRMIVSAGRE